MAFVGSGDQSEPIGLGDVYVVAADGGTPRRLAETPDRSANLLGWSADGSAVLVSETVGTTRQVIRVPADGAPAEPLTHEEGVVGGVSFAADGSRMAFTYQEPELPPEVWTAVPGRERVRVSHVNDEVPRPAMGRTELWRWTSADGTPVEGLITYPVGYEPGRRVPLILNVHGGPAGAFTRSFTGGPSLYMIQTFAQDGYAVLRPNPRGSTGYGKEFRYANFRDWGYGDFDDLMAGVDLAIERGVAHPDSLLLMGWSYGGYMTSFAVTRTDRFRAASMGAGLPNLISMVTTTDIQDYLAGHMGAEFWEDFDEYEKHSAIYHIANVVTPTQVIHGERDLRVPFTQGQEFYRALVRKGVPTEMIVLPRTPHGPREPKLLMRVTPLIEAWFEKHLRPGRATSEDGAGG
ncbi:MAG: S9 family peptidase [Gemmatimonadetes bacterium]|nr:MAG: S9 family peptidase [Gemmatimonadota bacterium]